MIPLTKSALALANYSSPVASKPAVKMNYEVILKFRLFLLTMILVSIVVAEELIKDGLVTQNLTSFRWSWSRCPGWCTQDWSPSNSLAWSWSTLLVSVEIGWKGNEMIIVFHCDASGILHRAFVAYLVTHLLKTQSANMKNSNTCKAFPALRAIGSNRYSPNCRNPWYIQYKPDLDEKKSVFITASF